MQLDLSNPDFASAVVNRLAKEYGDTSAGNFALDIIATQQSQRIAELEAINTAIAESNSSLRSENELLRTDRDRLAIELAELKNDAGIKTVPPAPLGRRRRSGAQSEIVG